MLIQREDFWRGVLAAVKDLDKASYYDLLGVPRDAGVQAIGDAYYALVRQIHPDRHAAVDDPEKQTALVRLNARVGEAYRVLTSPQRRRSYDAGLSRGKLRLLRDAGASKKQPNAMDPRTPQARTLYEHGKRLFDKGDRRGARAQWKLAIQFEPDSQAIQSALDALDAPESKPAASGGDGPAAASGPAATDASAAPAGATADAGPAAPAPVDPLADIRSLGQAGSSGPGSRAALLSAGVPAGPSRPDATPEPIFEEPTTSRLPSRVASAVGPRRKIPIRCGSWDQVEVLYRQKILGDGLVIRTRTPPRIGARVSLVAILPDDGTDTRTIELVGTVRAVDEHRQPSGKVGVTLEFGDLSPRTAAEFEAALNHEPPPPDAPAATPAVADAPALPAAAEPAPAAATAPSAPAATAPEAPHATPDAPAAGAASADARELGRRALAEGRHADAREHLTEALEAAPEDGSLRALFYIALAQQATAEGQPRVARIHLQTAVQFDPGSADFVR